MPTCAACGHEIEYEPAVVDGKTYHAGCQPLIEDDETEVEPQTNHQEITRDIARS